LFALGRFGSSPPVMRPKRKHARLHASLVNRRFTKEAKKRSDASYSALFNRVSSFIQLFVNRSLMKGAEQVRLLRIFGSVRFGFADSASPPFASSPPAKKRRRSGSVASASPTARVASFRQSTIVEEEEAKEDPCESASSPEVKSLSDRDEEDRSERSRAEQTKTRDQCASITEQKKPKKRDKRKNEY
jgi:hypothetical protein